MSGSRAYCKASRELVLGKDSEVLHASRVAIRQALGGLGALKVGSDVLKILSEFGGAHQYPAWVTHQDAMQGL